MRGTRPRKSRWLTRPADPVSDPRRPVRPTGHGASPTTLGAHRGGRVTASRLAAAFDRVDDFLAVQGPGISVDAVTLLQEAVGVDASARAVIGERVRHWRRPATRPPPGRCCSECSWVYPPRRSAANDAPPGWRCWDGAFPGHFAAADEPGGLFAGAPDREAGASTLPTGSTRDVCPTMSSNVSIASASAQSAPAVLDGPRLRSAEGLGPAARPSSRRALACGCGRHVGSSAEVLSWTL